MSKLVVRHATRDEVLTHHGFTPREHHTSTGLITDDTGAMEFSQPGDARAFMRLMGLDPEAHRIVAYESKTTQDYGVAAVKTEDFFGVRGDV